MGSKGAMAGLLLTIVEEFTSVTITMVGIKRAANIYRTTRRLVLRYDLLDTYALVSWSSG